MRPQLYETIAEDLRRRITSGEFDDAGGRLPSRPDLCEHYRVSRSVIDKAMILLRFAGLVEQQPGVGLFVKRPDDV